MRIKTTRHRFTPTRMVIIKMTDKNKGVRKLEPSYTANGNVIGAASEIHDESGDKGDSNDDAFVTRFWPIKNVCQFDGHFCSD